MQRVDSQPAYVLHAQPYRETSLLLDLLSRDHGRVGLVARGLRGARSQPLRAALQPLQPLLVGWAGRGELAQLSAAEAAGPALLAQGDALLGAFYVNELLVRLLPRGEPQQQLFWRYAECVGALAGADDFVWELRRFERDLLAQIGYAMQLEADADTGAAIDPAASYRYDPEVGAQRSTTRHDALIRGDTLLAFARDQMPSTDGMRALRLMMRRVLLHHLGGRELRSWQVLSDMAAQRALRQRPQV